jgi:hypothetical protein
MNHLRPIFLFDLNTKSETEEENEWRMTVELIKSCEF